MNVILHSDPIAIDGALTQLGLTEEALLTAVRLGYLARTNCTANHPPLFPSFVAWGETVRAVRDQLAPLGWTKTNERNYSRTLHPEKGIAIAVATGNEVTGLAGTEMPCTKSVKGPSTLDAIEVNRHQLWLPGMEPLTTSGDELEAQPTTWILLVHHAKNEIRSELSLPVDIGSDGKVSVWRERIILRAMPLDPTPVEISSPSLPDIDVVVRRKAL